MSVKREPANPVETTDGNRIKRKTSKQSLRGCPICLLEDADVLHYQRFALPEGHPLPDSYDLVVCMNCGFVYADTRSSQAVYDRYYQDYSKYTDPSVSTGGGAQPWDAARLSDTADEIAAFFSNHETDILDIGCANGGLLTALRSRGFRRIAGLDPSPACVRQVERQGLQASVGGLFSGPFSSITGHTYDGVLLSHVLEHVYDLHTAAANAVSLLTNGGTLYVEVPDASRYAEQYVVPFYYFDCEHINHFGKQSLVNLFDRFGCKPVKTGQKLMPVAADRLYPALYGFFRKKGPAASPHRIVRDTLVQTSVREYIRMSEEAGRHDQFEELAGSQRTIVVWGAGSNTLRLLGSTALGQCNILAFIDNDSGKQGGNIGGIPVLAPDELRAYPGAAVVISSALHAREIVRQIRKMELSNEIV